MFGRKFTLLSPQYKLNMFCVLSLTFGGKFNKLAVTYHQHHLLLESMLVNFWQFLIIFENLNNWDNIQQFDNWKDSPGDLWHLKHVDTDYNSDNWEPEYMTIIVTWQLRVTLHNVYIGQFLDALASLELVMILGV